MWRMKSYYDIVLKKLTEVIMDLIQKENDIQIRCLVLSLIRIVLSQMEVFMWMNGTGMKMELTITMMKMAIILEIKFKKLETVIMDLI